MRLSIFKSVFAAVSSAKVLLVIGCVLMPCLAQAAVTDTIYIEKPDNVIDSTVAITRYDRRIHRYRRS